jgi:para-nitrobenzyl esterase
MDPAIQGLSEEHMYGRFRRMAPAWDTSETVAAYKRVLAERGVPATPSEVYLAVMTARMFWIPTVQMLEEHGARGNPAYGYMFTWKAPFSDGKFGAFHGIDSGFLWDNYDPEVVGSVDKAARLSRRMQESWLAFARSGDPGTEDLGRWPHYGQRRETMLLGEECGVKEAPCEDERRIWDAAPDEVYQW